MSSADLGSLSIALIGKGLRAREFTCVEVVDAALASIDDKQPLLNAFVSVDAAAARAAAKVVDRELARGRDRGPLHGVPFAVKDLIAVAGAPMRAGSSVYRRRPRRDAAVVESLQHAGAVNVGLTRLHEIALGLTGLNPHDGGARNPRALGRVPGGSSSGSAAAVAAGLVPLALGTDTGGSVRIPAALCGVAGWKPTYGLLPTEGVMALAPTLDHVGFLARSFEDIRIAAAALGAIVPVALPDLRAVRIGILRGAERDLDAQVRVAFDRALALLRDSRAHVVDVEIDGAAAVDEMSATLLFYEAFRSHRKVFDADPTAFGADVRQRLAMGRAITAAAYAAALQDMRRLRAAAEHAFADVAFVVGPTVPVVAPAIGDAEAPARRAALPRNTPLFNLLGAPAVSIPLPTDGLPVGLQVAAWQGRDAALLALATAIERKLAAIA